MLNWICACLVGTILLSSCNKPNTSPVAGFSFTPVTGAMDTLFTFNASASSDNEDLPDVLEVRWDWETDGTWDTGFSTQKIAGHRFTNFTGNRVSLEVRDPKGLTGSVTRSVSITDSGTITGFDPRMCICCGGWFIRLQNDTLRFDQVPEASQSILENIAYPLNVRVKWIKKAERCLGDEIIILDMIRE